MCEHGTIDLTQLRAAQFNRRGFLRATAASTLTLALGARRRARRRDAHQVHARLGVLQPQLLPGQRAADREGRRGDAGLRHHADVRRTGDVPGQRPGRCRPDPLHQLRRAVRRRRAGEDHRRRRHPGLHPGGAARPRQPGEAEGQDARHVPDGYAGSAAVRLDEEARRELQGHQRPLHGQHARGGRGVQGRRARHDLHHRALWHRAAERREGQRDAVGRHRHLRPRLHRLRAGGARRPDQAEPGRVEVADQGHDEGAATWPRRKPEETLQDPGRRRSTRPRWRTRASPCRSSLRWWMRAARRSSSSTASSRIAEMGYIKKKPGRDAIDWTLLEQVIAANQDLYGKLKYKSAA